MHKKWRFIVFQTKGTKLKYVNIFLFHVDNDIFFRLFNTSNTQNVFVVSFCKIRDGTDYVYMGHIYHTIHLPMLA